MRTLPRRTKSIITSSLALSLMLFLSGCFEKDIPIEQKSYEQSKLQESEFPLNTHEELDLLAKKEGRDCFDNILCIDDQNANLAKSFAFKKGQLILRGPNLVSQLSDAWLVNSHINIIAEDNVKNIMSEYKESQYHAYYPKADKFKTLSPGYNFNLEKPIEPKLVFQRRLGLPELTYKSPNFCNLIEAEEFIAKSHSALLPHSFDLIDSAPNSGFDENTQTYAAETIVLCGGISLLNQSLTLEAKNIVFYNTKIEVSADQDMSAGIKIIADNLGYFGHNTIISNIIDTKAERKINTAPTVDISVSNKIDVIDSESSPNNPFNSHSFNILMSGEAEKNTVIAPNSINEVTDKKDLANMKATTTTD